MEVGEMAVILCYCGNFREHEYCTLYVSHTVETIVTVEENNPYRHIYSKLCKKQEKIILEM